MPSLPDERFSVVYLLLIVLMCGQASFSFAQTKTIRVWLLAAQNPQQVVVSASNGPLYIRGNSGRTMKVYGGRQITLSIQNRQVVIDGEGNMLSAPSVELSVEPEAYLKLRAGSISRGYVGYITVDVTSDGRALQLINHVPLEDYVASVVASEFPFKTIEGAKAQAVIARTYAIHAHRDQLDEPYDVTDNTSSQAYYGITRVTRVSRRAARETAGEILTYRNEPIEAVYFSSSGGHTADNEDVWNTAPVPYLRGKRDPYDSPSPHEQWKFNIAKSFLHEMLSDAYGFTVEEIHFDDRSEEGRHRTVLLAGDDAKRINANMLRLLIIDRFGSGSLKSTFFHVEETRRRYIFEGKGFGHGVGLSQYGARNRAKAGQSYEEILHFYYTNVQLEDLEGIQRPAIALAPETDAEEEQEKPEEQNEPPVEATTATRSSSLHGGWAAPRGSAYERPLRPGW